MENSYQVLHELGLSLSNELRSSQSARDCCTHSADCLVRVQTMLDQWRVCYQLAESFGEWIALGNELTGSDQQNEWDREEGVPLQQSKEAQPLTRSSFPSASGIHDETGRTNPTRDQSLNKGTPAEQKKSTSRSGTVAGPQSAIRSYQQYQQRTQQMLDQLIGAEPAEGKLKDTSTSQVLPKENKDFTGNALSDTTDPWGTADRREQSPKTPPDGSYHDPYNDDDATRHFQNEPPGFERIDKSGNDDIPDDQFTENRPFDPASPADSKSRGSNASNAIKSSQQKQRIHSSFKGLQDFAQQIRNTGDGTGNTRHEIDGLQTGAGHGPFLHEMPSPIEHQEDQSPAVKGNSTAFHHKSNHQKNWPYEMKDSGDHAAGDSPKNHAIDGTPEAWQDWPWPGLSAPDHFDIDDLWEAMTNKLRQDYKRHYGD